jgi:phage repressor protein C with HTH and peptisase S24 domain
MEHNLDQFHTESLSEPQETEEKRSGLMRFVDGASMEPTLQSGEFVIVNKLAYLL